MKSILFLFILLGLSSCILFRPGPEKNLRNAIVNKPLDVIIVPGVPLENGKWDSIMKARVMWSAYLYKAGIVKNIIYSGNAVYSKWIEGKGMALYGEALGVKHEHIYIDSLAEHSTENVFYGYKQAKALGFNKIGVASDPFQCALLYRFAKKRFRTKIHMIPIVFDTLKQLDHTNPIINSDLAIKNNFVSIVENQSFRHRWRGTRGKNLKFEKRRLD